MTGYSPPFFRRLICFFVLSCWIAAFAQQTKKMVWGKVDTAQFGTSLTSQFPDAPAVVLHDYGTLSLGVNEQGYYVILERHVRIRILTEEGKAYALQSIPYQFRAPEGAESVRKIKAQTLLYREGTVRRMAVPQKDIRTVRTDANWNEVQLTFPEVKAGAIIEYRYRLTSSNYYQPPEWPFQREIPTLVSELYFRQDKILDYAVLLLGGQGEQLQMSSTHHWRLENLPPIREEPFTTTLLDNWQRLHFRLRGERSFVGYEPTLYSWEKFSDNLLQAPDLGGRLDPIHDSLHDIARELAGFFGEPEKKIDILFQAVRDRIQWDEGFDCLAPQTLEEVWTTKRGNSAEINLLLVYLLRAAGIAADPLLIATRAHGAPIRSYPDLTSFNHLICYVEWGDEGLFLDATDPLRSSRLPDSRDLNRVGWLLSKELARWVTLSPRPFVATQQVLGALTLDSTGMLQGQLSELTAGYTALAYRRAIKARGEAAFVQQYLADYLPTGTVTTYSIRDQDLPENPLTVEWEIRSGDFATATGDRIVLSPLLMFAMQNNPMPDMQRYQPVDFGHPYQSVVHFSFTLPENYVVESLPEPLTVAFPNREALLDFRCKVLAGTVTIESRFSIQAAVFTAEAYEPLRSMYAQLMEKHAEKIVLRRR